jgi:hypothetical protein
MTNEEICRDYRLAKNKANQVNILVDMTGYDRADILSILVNGGEQVDKRLYGNNKGAKPPAPKRPDAKKKERPDTIVLSREEADALADFMAVRLQPWIRSQEQDLAQIHLLTGIYLKL